MHRIYLLSNMKKIFILFLLVNALLMSGLTQNLTLSSSQINFGNVYENAPDSVQITLKNGGIKPILVRAMKFYDDNYGNTPFSSVNVPFSINANDSAMIWVKFAPVHNIFHNSECIILTDEKKGAYRLDLQAQGKYSNPYYNTTENLSEQALKTALTNRITIGATTLTYNAARDEMFMNLDNQKFNGQNAAVNTLECIYTGRLATGYTSRTDCQTNDNFNTEHTFPQSLFNSVTPMLSDLHHIFPTDNTANNTRGNAPFGTVSSPTWQVGGSKFGGGKFEPRDVQKGRTARAMLYFVLRYQDYSCFLQPQESILRQWHKQFLPNNIDKNRNSGIYAAQGNRNPFVDYPQFIDRISLMTTCAGNSVGAVSFSANLPQDSANFGNIPLNINNLYNFAIVNDGNQTDTISNLSFGSPNLMFHTSTGNDTTLAPGEALILNFALNLSSLGSFQSYLSYKFRNNTIQVPVTAFGIDNTAIENTPQKFDFQLFPNPATQNISVVTSQKGMLSIWNAMGERVILQTVNVGKSNVSLVNLPAGVYIAKWEEKGDFVTKTFVKL